MSSKSKGKRFENLVAKTLETFGYHIAFKSQYVRFGQIDFDAIWDIVAIKRSGNEVSWMFVQCKSRKMYGKEKQVLVDWVKKYGFEGINCFVAVKVKEGRKNAILWHNLSMP